MAEIYDRLPGQVEAVQWDGTNTDEVVTFAGPDNCIVSNGRFQIRADGAPATSYWDMYPGSWLTRDLSDGFTIVSSSRVFIHEYRRREAAT